MIFKASFMLLLDCFRFHTNIHVSGTSVSETVNYSVVSMIEYLKTLLNDQLV